MKRQHHLRNHQQCHQQLRQQNQQFKQSKRMRTSSSGQKLHVIACSILLCFALNTASEAASASAASTAVVRQRLHHRARPRKFFENDKQHRQHLLFDRKSLLLHGIGELRGGHTGGAASGGTTSSISSGGGTAATETTQHLENDAVSSGGSTGPTAGATATRISQAGSSSNTAASPPLVSSSSSSPPSRPAATATTAVTASSSASTTVSTKDASKVQPPAATPRDTSTTALVETPKQEKKEDPRVMFLIRLLFLSYYGSLGSLMPFLPVYYHSLGHGGQIIGMLGAVKPFTTFLVAPLWGLVSDQTDCPFFILQMTFLVSLVGQLLVGVRHEPWYIMAMVFITAVFNAPVKSLIDSMVMDHIVDQSSYGRLRLWGQMGFGLGSSGVGVMLSKSQPIAWGDITNNYSPWFENAVAKLPVSLQSAVAYTDKFWQSLTGYKLLFMTYAGLSIPTYLCMQAFRRLDAENKKKEVQEHQPQQQIQEADKPTDNKEEEQSASTAEVEQTNDIGKGLRLLAQNTDALLFFFLIFCIGMSSGIIENFAYVRIREVGGAGKEMGMSRLVSSLAGAPMFWFSGTLTNMFGVDRILVVSLLSYVTRFLIYAAMQNPYQGLPAEALRGVTFAAFWSSATIYAHKVSPSGLHATMLMLLNAMYGGLGQSLGALLGGKLQHKFGTVWTFVYSALMDLVLVGVMIVYLSTKTGETSFHNPTPIVDRSTATAGVAASDTIETTTTAAAAPTNTPNANAAESAKNVNRSNLQSNSDVNVPGHATSYGSGGDGSTSTNSNPPPSR